MGFSFYDFCRKTKPFLAVIFLQFGYSGMAIISKVALNQGTSQHVLVVYRQIVAATAISPFAIVFDRKIRPKMTISIFIKIVLMGLLEPTIDQNLYYTGMKYTTATYSSAMCNILPALAFLLAWACRLEKVDIKKLDSQAKILGTVVTVGGAMLMTLFKGTKLDLPWTRGYDNQQHSTNLITKQDPLKGALMVSIGSVCWASFIILQAITLKSYPAELSLTVLICSMGAIEGTILAVAMERGNPSAWSMHFDSKLLAAVYSGVICSGVAYWIQGMVMKGVICSGVAYWIQGMVMKVKGPVFVTAFNPLSMVIVAIMGSVLLSETMYLGRLMGAAVIVTGLYLVLWGKSKDIQSDINKGMEISQTNQLTENSNQGIAIDVGNRVTPDDECV